MKSGLMLAFALLALIAVSLQRTYARVPLKELKRRARHGDALSAAMLKAVGYGHSLRAVLWLLIGLTTAGFFVLVGQTAPLWFAITASAILVWLGFVWIPAARVSFISEHVAAWCAPALAKLMQYTHPVLQFITRMIRKIRPVHIHTGLYDRYDLIDLLERQQVQPDNRIEQAEITIARHALSFGDDTIGQHMTPRRAVKSVPLSEALGPVVIDELYESSHARFPVYDGKKDNIVGVLYLRDLVRVKNGGNVSKLMKHGVSYLHEEQSLHDALQAVIKTHHQLFIVVNSFEEFVGIITAEDVLNVIIGAPIMDDFEQYDDLRAVAERAAKKEHQEHVEEQEELPEEPAALQEVAEESQNEPDMDVPEEELEAFHMPEAEEMEQDESARELEIPEDLPEESESEEPESPAKPVKRTYKEEDIDETIEL